MLQFAPKIHYLYVFKYYFFTPKCFYQVFKDNFTYGHLLDKIGDYLHHYNLEDRRPVHAKKDQMKKAESYWIKIKPYLKMKNISKKNRRTMIKDDEGLLRGRTNHVYVLPTKEKPT